MIRTLLLIITLAGGLNLAAQQTWTLQQAVEYAVTNNITVKQARVQAKLAQLNLKQAKNARLPTAQASIQGGFQHGLNENPTTGTLESANFISGSIGAQSGYTIFNWGARKNNIAANQLLAEADEVGIARAQNDIALLVANAYLQVMLRQEQVRISEAAVKLSSAQLNNASKLVEAGSQPELNRIQAEAQLAKDSAQLLLNQSLVQEGLITLKAYLNIDIAEPFILNPPRVEDIPLDNLGSLQPADVYSQAVVTQPLQRQFGLRIEAGKRQVANARALMYPSLAGFIGLNTRYINSQFPIITGIIPNQPTGAYFFDNSGSKINVLSDRPVYGQRSVGILRQLNNNFGQSIGLSINIPIFNGGANRIAWQRAQLNVQQTMLQDEQAKIDLKNNIYTAYQQAFAAMQRYQASGRTVAANRRALELAQKRFDIGLLGTLDFIITQNNLTTAQIEEASNRYDFIFKMKVLEFYKGNGIKL